MPTALEAEIPCAARDLGKNAAGLLRKHWGFSENAATVARKKALQRGLVPCAATDLRKNAADGALANRGEGGLELDLLQPCLPSFRQEERGALLVDKTLLTQSHQGGSHAAGCFLGDCHQMLWCRWLVNGTEPLDGPQQLVAAVGEEVALYDAELIVSTDVGELSVALAAQLLNGPPEDEGAVLLNVLEPFDPVQGIWHLLESRRAANAFDASSGAVGMTEHD